jgi:hypothetical protein
MNKLFYKILYIDLKPSIDVIFNNIKTRTEIRKAKKSDVKVKIFQNHVDDYIIRVCSGMLKRTLKREYVPYSSVFDSILRDKNNVLMIALLDDKIISFISLSLKAELEFFKNKKNRFFVSFKH